MTERHPIITQPGVNVRLVQSPLSVAELFPDYRYEFESQHIAPESQNMFNNLAEFIHTNEELAVSTDYTSREDYVKGFQKALAITRLWIDSIYLDSEAQDGRN